MSYAQVVYIYADKEDNEFYNHYAFELTQVLIKLLSANKTQHPIHLLYISQFLNFSISSGFVNANLESIFNKVDNLIKEGFKKEATDRMFLLQGLLYIISRIQNTAGETEYRNDLVDCYEAGLKQLGETAKDGNNTFNNRFFDLTDFLPKTNVAGSCKNFSIFLANKETKSRLKAILSEKIEKDKCNELQALLLTAYSEVTNQAELYIPQLVFYLNLQV